MRAILGCFFLSFPCLLLRIIVIIHIPDKLFYYESSRPGWQPCMKLSALIRKLYVSPEPQSRVPEAAFRTPHQPVHRRARHDPVLDLGVTSFRFSGCMFRCLRGRRLDRSISRLLGQLRAGQCPMGLAKRSSVRWISCNAPPAATCSSSPPITWPAPIAAMRWSRRSNTPSNLHADLPTNTCHLHGFS